MLIIGSYEHRLDLKGRLIIPSRYRQDFSSSLILTKGIDQCLYLYQEKDFKRFIDKLAAIPFTKKDGRFFLRFFLANATTIELDKQGRLLIPHSLIQYANLVDDCVIIGVLDHIELWSKEKWEQTIMAQEGKITEISEHLFDETHD